MMQVLAYVYQRAWHMLLLVQHNGMTTLISLEVMQTTSNPTVHCRSRAKVRCRLLLMCSKGLVLRFYLCTTMAGSPSPT